MTQGHDLNCLEQIESDIDAYMHAEIHMDALSPLKTRENIQTLTSPSSSTPLQQETLQDLQHKHMNTLLRLLAAYESDPLIDRVSAAISVLCGRGGPFTRFWNFHIHPDQPIRLSIREPSFCEADLGWKTWGGGILLCKMLLRNQVCLPASPMQNQVNMGEDGPLRILELGSGTGLFGLTLMAYLHRKSVHARVDLTDFNDAVIRNLKVNVAANQPNDPRLTADVLRLDWFEYLNGENRIDDGQTYDVVFAADVIYNDQHADAIALVVEHRLKRTKEACFHCVLPLRPQYQLEVERFERNMKQHGFTACSVDFWDQDVQSTSSGSDDEEEDPMCRDGVWYRWYPFRRVFDSGVFDAEE